MKRLQTWKMCLFFAALTSLGACHTVPENVRYLGQSEITVKRAAFAELTPSDWKDAPNVSCITHLYNCSFNEAGDVTSVSPMDLSRPQFEEFSAESLRTFKFNPGKAGQCFVDFIYTSDGKARVVILQDDEAKAVATRRKQYREALAKVTPVGPSVTPVSRVKPLFPHEAEGQGTPGQVKLLFDVDPDGVPINIRITRSQPAGLFDDTTLRAVRQWRYKTVAEEPNVNRKDIAVTISFHFEGSLGYDCELNY